MNRKIKFRAWNEKRKCMMFYIEAMDGDNLLAVDEQGGFIGPAEWKTMVFMQYTGLTDKNGKEIYEGDICLSEGDWVCYVEWDNKEAWFCFVDPRDNKPMIDNLYVDKEVEVVGNVFENPELLKEDKNDKK